MQLAADQPALRLQQLPLLLLFLGRWLRAAAGASPGIMSTASGSGAARCIRCAGSCQPSPCCMLLCTAHAQHVRLPAQQVCAASAGSSLISTCPSPLQHTPQVKLVSWYDNEYGYSCRMCDLLQYIAAVDKQAK